MDNWGLFLAVLGAAFAVGLPAIGSARGVGLVGEAGAGLLSEDTSMFKKVFLLQILPGSQGLYGLLLAIIVFNKIGFLSGTVASLALGDGLTIFAGCLPMAFVGLFSAIYQGRVAAAGISLIAIKPNQVVKAMIMSAFVETYALLALLVSFIVVNSVQFTA